MACSSADQTGNEVFVGGYRIIDQQIPFPYLFIKSESEVGLYSPEGQMISRAISPSVWNQNDTLDFGQRKYLILGDYSPNKYTLFDLNDTTRYKNPKFVAVIHRAPISGNISLSTLTNQLNASTWEFTQKTSTPNRDLSIQRIYEFGKTQVVIKNEYSYKDEFLYSESHRTPYSLFELEGRVFLALNPGEHDNNPREIYLITSIKRDLIRCVGFNEREIQEESFTRIKEKERMSSRPSTTYKPCFFGDVGEYYYGDDVTYNEGNDYIINLANHSLPSNDQTGYINVHFNVNCHGEIGDFGLEQMSLSFEPMEFSSKMVKHIFNVVVNLEDWPKVVNDYSWIDYEDVHAFLMFKIIDGKVVDLCP